MDDESSPGAVIEFQTKKPVKGEIPRIKGKKSVVLPPGGEKVVNWREIKLSQLCRYRD
jgi:hypothetical protein